LLKFDFKLEEVHYSMLELYFHEDFYHPLSELVDDFLEAPSCFELFFHRDVGDPLPKLFFYKDVDHSLPKLSF
jgi:hypothetical protein